MASGTALGIASGIIGGTDETEFKVRENRLRRMAQRQGLRLEKSRRRDPLALGYGTYQLVRVETERAHPDRAWRGRELVAYGSSSGYGLTLDEIERALAEA